MILFPFFASACSLPEVLCVRIVILLEHDLLEKPIKANTPLRYDSMASDTLPLTNVGVIGRVTSNGFVVF
jgi:hypothetical protein